MQTNVGISDVLGCMVCANSRSDNMETRSDTIPGLHPANRCARIASFYQQMRWVKNSAQCKCCAPVCQATSAPCPRAPPEAYFHSSSPHCSPCLSLFRRSSVFTIRSSQQSQALHSCLSGGLTALGILLTQDSSDTSTPDWTQVRKDCSFTSATQRMSIELLSIGAFHAAMETSPSIVTVDLAIMTEHKLRVAF